MTNLSGIEPYEGLPDKQRLIAAMRGEPTDRVPNFEILIEDRHVEHLLGRKAGNTLGVGGDPAKGSEAAEGVRPMVPNDYLELCRIIGQDAIVLENSGPRSISESPTDRWFRGTTAASKALPTSSGSSGPASRISNATSPT